MPTKVLDSPFKNGAPHDFKFGGGANTIIANHDPDDPDVGYQSIDGGGGNDTITGSKNGDLIIGGTGSDDVNGGLGDDTIYGGEDATGTDAAKGKNALLRNNLIGDDDSAAFASGSYAGGNDTILGGDGGTNNIYGDIRNPFSFTATNTMFTGGNDILTGGDGAAGNLAFNNIYGDAVSVLFSAASEADSFTGGNDTLTGGDFANNLMLGDLQSFSNIGEFIGGNDTIIGGSNGVNTMIGDLVSFGSGSAGNVTGGEDRLVSGTNSNDTMTGDFGSGFPVDLPPLPGEEPLYTQVGGNDTFVFAANNGQDTITDFGLAEFDGDGLLVDAHDVIDLTAFGASLNFEMFDTSDGAGGGPDGVLGAGDAFITINGGIVIDLGAASGTADPGFHTVTVAGAVGLTAEDFDFFEVALA